MVLFQMVQWLQARLASDERGAAAVEYGLLISLIAAAIVLLVSGLGTEVGKAFTAATEAIKP